MIRTFSKVLVLVGVVYSLLISPVAAYDHPPRIITDFFDVILGEIKKGADSGFGQKPKKQKIPSITTNSTGWCQVWRGAALTDQEECVATKQCDELEQCKNTYVWPSGNKTVIMSNNGIPKSINGKRVHPVVVAGEICSKNLTSGNSFCFTILRQESPSTRVTKRTPPEPDNTQNSRDTSVDQFQSLLDEYLAASDEKNNSPSMQKRRCDSGSELALNHSGKLEKDMLDFILQQLDADKCLG